MRREVWRRPERGIHMLGHAGLVVSKVLDVIVPG